MVSFDNLAKIDAHVHFNTFCETLFAYGSAHNFRFLSINTDMPFFPSLGAQEKTSIRLAEKYGRQLNFVTTFSCDNWGSENWTEVIIEKIRKSIKLGAVGVKVWKNIGMSLKDEKGSYISIDHPSFDPIFRFLEENDIVLLGHIGEPKNCWLPLHQMTVASDRDYFSRHPEYHMYLHSECLSYEAHLKARDNRLKKHPGLRYVGLHLASEEWDTDEVAGFLNDFPNAMVDLAERICHLQHQAMTEWQKIYNFLIDYQDRIIYGTDCVEDNGLTDKELVNHMAARYRMHWKFFTEKEIMSVPKVTGDFRGMGLPFKVIEKIYYKNAIKTYGI